MYLIPQTSSHVHMLVSVFPSFGLLFALGFYIAAFHTKNDNTKRICLLLIGLLAFLSVPVYLSGIDSAAALSGKIPANMLNAHTGPGMAALVVLVVTGLAAFVELARSRRSAVDPRHVVLALAVLTLCLTVVADELGYQAGHRELQSTVSIPDVSTSPLWPHVHIILNHVPTAGFVFALFFFLAALLTRNNGMLRGSLVLFVICSIAGVPTYVTGTASMWALTQPPIPEISKAVINAHRDMALWTLLGLAATGGAAWIELWRYRHVGRFSKVALTLVLLLALITLGVMTETGHRGGLINHPEIRTAADILPTDPDAGISVAIEAQMKAMTAFLPWQIVHFFGYCLIFAATLAICLRVLGFWKSLSFAAMHRILVLGFLGVLMNVISGMLMMLADSYRYIVSDTLFAPKMALIPIGVMAALYFSASDRLWKVEAGQGAPATAKWVALVTLIAWAGVIICGRLLPYI